MKRLSLLIDGVAQIRNALKSDAFDPVQFGIIAETCGANGLVCTFTGRKNSLSERDLKLLKGIRKSFFNLRIPIQEDAVHQALSLAPDMVTFANIKLDDPSSVSPIEPSVNIETIRELLSDLQVNDISVSVLIQPEINVLKDLSKLSIDYVELDASDYTSAPDINVELVALDKINSAAVAATKLGMGVNCSGGIRYEHVSELSKIPNLEDITLGAQFVERCLLVGIDKAVSEALQLIRHRDVD